jgi:hypothetical protein
MCVRYEADDVMASLGRWAKDRYAPCLPVLFLLFAVDFVSENR